MTIKLVHDRDAAEVKRREMIDEFLRRARDRSEPSEILINELLVSSRVAHERADFYRDVAIKLLEAIEEVRDALSRSEAEEADDLLFLVVAEVTKMVRERC